MPLRCKELRIGGLLAILVSSMILVKFFDCSQRRALFWNVLVDPVRWNSVLATSRRVLATTLFSIWPCGKNARISHGTRQNDWAKIQLILAHSSWPALRNTGILRCFTAFWAKGCVRKFWPDLFRMANLKGPPDEHP